MVNNSDSTDLGKRLILSRKQELKSKSLGSLER